MSLMRPGSLSFEFGSSVTILTTAAACANHTNRLSGKGIFTGIVLDKSKLKYQPELHRVTVTVDAKYAEADECNAQDHQSQGKCPQPEFTCKKHGKPQAKAYQDFVVISLTSPSFPYEPGQIVWISLDEIVAVAAECRNY